MLLRSVGSAVACGLNEEVQRELLTAVADRSYAQAAAGARRAVLLRCDGGAAARGVEEELSASFQRRSPTCAARRLLPERAAQCRSGAKAAPRRAA